MAKRMVLEIVDGVVYLDDGSFLSERAYNDILLDTAWDKAPAPKVFEQCRTCGLAGKVKDESYCIYCEE